MLFLALEVLIIDKSISKPAIYVPRDTQTPGGPFFIPHAIKNVPRSLLLTSDLWFSRLNFNFLTVPGIPLMGV